MSVEEAVARRSLSQVRRGNEELRKAYEQGLEIQERCPLYADELTLRREAAERKTNLDTLRKLRQLVDPKRGGYTRDELAELCRQCMRGGHPISRSVLFQLLRIQDTAERAKFAERLIKERWKRQRVNVEIRKRFGARRSGGRKRKLPIAVPDAMAALDGMCRDWLRWCAQLEDTESDTPHVAWNQLPTDVRRQLESARQAIETLQAAVAASSKKPKSAAGRKGRSGTSKA